MLLSPRAATPLILLLSLSSGTRAAEFVGDVTRFSPDVGQPLFPIGNINFFKQYAFGFDERLSVGKKVDIGFATFGAELQGRAKAQMGIEVGMCIGGNADFDLGFKPRITVPDKYPYEYPLTLAVSEGLMPDSVFTTNFPPLGKAYADLIFDVGVGFGAEVCVFGCFDIPAIELDTCSLGGLLPGNLSTLFAKSVRCDPTIDKEAYCAIELASWNRNDDNKFKMLNVFAKNQAEFIAEPRKEFGGGFESGGGGVFTANPSDDSIETAGKSFANDAEVALTSKGTLPGGLAEKKVYYVVKSTGTKFKLATRKNGTPLDIINAGTGEHTISASSAKKPGTPAFDPASYGKVSITAPTISTDSSVSAVDERERSFTVNPSNDRLIIEPVVDFKDGLRGFPNASKVRVKSDSTLPAGLRRGCIYYVVDSEAEGLSVKLSTSVGGPPVDIKSLGGIGLHRIYRSAEFNSVDGLVSTGAEDVAAVTIDVAKLLGDAILPFPLSGGIEAGPFSADYTLASLELGPAIQLQTDFKMSWDLVVDNIVFRKAGTMVPAQVQIGSRFFSSLKPVGAVPGAFPATQVFHLMNSGPNKLPDISLLNGDPVWVTITYHVEPKLQTKVSAPFFGRVKYTALEAGAAIEKVGSLRLGPLVEGEHKFQFGEFVFYDGDPFSIKSGAARTDFEESQDRDRYELVLINESAGEFVPATGCAEVIVSKKSTGALHLTIFDVEGQLMKDRSGPAIDKLGPTMAAQLLAQLTPWPTPDADKKAAILKAATQKVVGLVPGAMSFELQAAGPANYIWKPVAVPNGNSETEFNAGGTVNPNTLGKTTTNTPTGAAGETASLNDWKYDVGTNGGASESGYGPGGPKGVWRYGYLEPGANEFAWKTSSFPKAAFTPFSAANWQAPGVALADGTANTYRAGVFREKNALMEKFAAAPAEGIWPVRRWISAGGKVDVTWGGAMLPRQRWTVNYPFIDTDGVYGPAGNYQPWNDMPAAPWLPANDSRALVSDGVSLSLFVNGVLQDSMTTTNVPTPVTTGSELNFSLVFYSPTYSPALNTYEANEPMLAVTNTSKGSINIRTFSLTIGNTAYNYDIVNPVNFTSGVSMTHTPDQFNGGANSDTINLDFASNSGGGLRPGQTAFFRVDIDLDGNPGVENYRTVLFNNGTAPNAVATATSSTGGLTRSMPLPDGRPDWTAYRFETDVVESTDIANLASSTRTTSLTLKEGDVVDLVLSPRGVTNSPTAWQDESIMVMDIKAQNYEWATSATSPSNWIELLTGNQNKPGAYPGSIFKALDPILQAGATATNWATIEAGPWPNLAESETIGSLNVKPSARLDFSPVTTALGLTVHDGAVANNGTINIRKSAGNTNAVGMTLGGPNVQQNTILSGEGTIVLQNSALKAWKPNSAVGPIHQFQNFNVIQGSGEAMNLLASHQNSQISNSGTFEASGGSLETGAQRFINAGQLNARNAGNLAVQGNFLESRVGSIISSVEGTEVFLQFDEMVSAGQVFAGGNVLLYPRSAAEGLLSVGESLGGADSGTFYSHGATGLLILGNLKVDGGQFFARLGGGISTGGARTSFSGSRIEIGRFDATTVNPASGNLTMNATDNIFTGTSLNNYGTINVGQNADFIDSTLFANHGTVNVFPDTTLRVREVTEQNPDSVASASAKKSPGVANATGETLLGGRWEISGNLLLDGANLNKIGADSSHVDTTSAVANVGQPAVYTPQADPKSALALGKPAEVVLSGSGASFPALHALRLNGGTFELRNGAVFPKGAASQYTAGTLTNRGKMVVENSALKIGGDYIQQGAGASALVSGTADVSTIFGVYHIHGGSVTVGPTAKFMNLNAARNGFLAGTTIEVRSVYIREGNFGFPPEITPASVALTGATITGIGPEVDLTLFGSEVTFPTAALASNAGRLVVGGDHGIDNAGSVVVPDFTNTGRIEVSGSSSELRSGSFTQNGASAVTSIGTGSKLQSSGALAINGGEVLVNLGARPGRFDSQGTIQAGNTANFNNRLVINFVEDFLEVKPDVGDTWEIMPRNTSTSITGFATTVFRVNGAPMPANWLPAGTFLEMVQLPTSFPAPRGLAVRVTPVGGFLPYSTWATSFLGGPLPPVYAALAPQYFYGAKTDGSPRSGDLISSLVDVNGDQHYQVSYRRRTGVEGSMGLYGSTDLKAWSPAPAAVLNIIRLNDGSGMEIVNLRSTFALPTKDHLFLRVQGDLNSDNVPTGMVSSKPISRNGGLRKNQLESYLRTEVFRLPAGTPLPYQIVQDLVLYFEVTGDMNGNGTYGGTAANGGDRNFIYRDNSELSGAAMHAGLLNNQERGVVKVTLIPIQSSFLGSQQRTGGQFITSQTVNPTAPDSNEFYSYRIELSHKFQ